MDKQGEIREGTGHKLAEIYSGKLTTIELADVDKLLAYLHSQGVVIKVEKALPVNPFLYMEALRGVPVMNAKKRQRFDDYAKAQKDMVEAGGGFSDPIIWRRSKKPSS